VKGGKYQEHSWPISADNVTKVIYGTWGVVNEPGGTGVRAQLPGLNVCGKTGTAQLASNDFLKGKTGKEFEDNAWFVGFAPRDAPEIVVVALYDHGGHGQFAAPVARDVLKSYFDKKTRLAAERERGKAAEGATIGQFLRFGLPLPPAPAPTDQDSPVIEAAYISSGDDDGTVPITGAARKARPAAPQPVHSLAHPRS
jgi:membrane peptidoglycan carboxypeptidase